ncbi:MAG: hypothetical protein P8H56_09715 [Crocinitomicaceae bacterium]|nr:hypothetical protein [Crocinitomicaceae bacterium]MDG1658848.1 hypothetical protein [Crocinitomicaceae bacterium]
MKKTLLSLTLIGFYGLAFSQNISDNKISFGYTQLPYYKIDAAFTNYDVKVEHGYLKANADSLALHEASKELAMSQFENAMRDYNRSKDSVDAIYLTAMAKWEKDINSGLTQVNGLALPQPIRATYAPFPSFPSLEAPRLHKPYEDNNVINAIDIQGYTKGMGGFVATINLLPIQNIVIKESKKGAGTSTKYTYTASYKMPIELTVESPTQGKVMYLRIVEGTKTYKIGEYSSKYDFQLYMLTNEDAYRNNLELAARQQAVAETNTYLNNQVGYMSKSRTTEFYSVKKFKNYDYSDVSKAYMTSVTAFQLVAADRDRESAIDKIDEALAEWAEIMIESNTFDNKARINDKITQMIQVNMAELMLWKADFANSELNTTLAIGGGGKFKRHANSVKNFYADQKKRWSAHY